MILKEVSFLTPRENILYDEVLLMLAEGSQNQETLRFWESQRYFIVLGRTSKEGEDIKLDEVKKDKIEILRRFSGGGTVIQGKGCLNFSLILSKKNHPDIIDLKKSYQFILNKVISSLKNLSIHSEFLPVSDLALIETNKKFSGNAQKRGRKYILHHGTILYNFDLDKIEKYLKIPKVYPEYRNGRMHNDFVTNINVDIKNFKKELAGKFNITDHMDTAEDIEINLLKEIAISKKLKLI